MKFMWQYEQKGQCHMYRSNSKQHGVPGHMRHTYNILMIKNTYHCLPCVVTKLMDILAD